MTRKRPHPWQYVKTEAVYRQVNGKRYRVSLCYNHEFSRPSRPLPSGSLVTAYSVTVEGIHDRRWWIKYFPTWEQACERFDFVIGNFHLFLLEQQLTK